MADIGLPKRVIRVVEVPDPHKEAPIKIEPREAPATPERELVPA